MNIEVWKFLWNEFCESQTHLDTLLSRIPDTYGPNIKNEVATRFGPFLRRPWTIAKSLGVSLAETPEEFWSQSYIHLKKNEAVHETLDRLAHSPARLPSEGTRDDFPPSLIATWEADWGSETADRLCALLSQEPLTVIRMHRNFVEKADELFPKSRPGRFSPRARIFRGYEVVLRNETHKNGGLEIQDEGSQTMSWFTLYPQIFKRALSASPQIHKQNFDAFDVTNFPSLSALTVVDACAGAGGKTLALADFLKGQGRIYAYDVYDKKIQALRRRASRAHETNIQAVALDPESLLALQEKFAGTADIVLVDSPCSGQGVLRRNPDIKWNRKPMPKSLEKTLTLEELQQRVLTDYLPLVKKGGRFVFGVCTFKKSESIDQVEWLLNYAKEKGIELKLKESGFVGPYETDGFYMASFEK